jgi:N-methylhydantoinase A/oxoprolinase/acetone carboxylase beta subunit
LTRADGDPITASDVEAAVEEFHRRNEAARLIEARAQEPTVRGVRLLATGLVPQPSVAARPAPGTNGAPTAIGARRVHVGGDWHDDVPVYDGGTLVAPMTITGPALVKRSFTTVVLRPGDTAHARANGDLLVDVAPT